MGRGIQRTGDVTYSVQALLAAGTYVAPEGPVLQSLLDGQVVVVPYLFEDRFWMDIAARQGNAGEWWVLSVARYGVTLYPFSADEIRVRVHSNQDYDSRPPPTAIDSLWTPTSNGSMAWGLWNVKVRNIARL